MTDWNRSVGLPAALGALFVLLLAVGSGTAQDYAAHRAQMVDRQIAARGVSDPVVLAAMRRVPRHEFVPVAYRASAYSDRPLPIGRGQTISQPYIVAYMTAAVEPDSADRVLEVGTGSGYQAAVLAEIVDQVKTVEIVPELGREARTRLERLGYGTVEVRIGNGYRGWSEHAPYDAILVTAAPESIPDALIRQLAPGGRMVVPVGPQSAAQELTLVRKQTDGTIQRRTLTPVRFVPLVDPPE